MPYVIADSDFDSNDRYTYFAFRTRRGIASRTISRNHQYICTYMRNNARDPRRFVRRVIHTYTAGPFFVLTHPHLRLRNVRLRLLSTFATDIVVGGDKGPSRASNISYLARLGCRHVSSRVRIDHATARIAFLYDAKSSRERSALRKEKGPARPGTGD